MNKKQISSVRMHIAELKKKLALYRRALRIQWVTFNKHNPWAVFAIKAGAVFCLLGITAIIVFLSSISMGAFGKLPQKADLADITNNLATEVYAENGELLGRYYFENRSYVKYENISPHFIQALVATEDARFFEHNGIDFRSWLRVFFKSILLNQRASGGGSTISQQLSKNLYPRQDFGDPMTSLLINKLKEIFIARRLERLYSKEEILELYLNTVPFSENTYGIKVAAYHFFGNTPADLNANQSAILVAMLKATSVYNPVSHPELSFQRRNLVLQQMAKYRYLDQSTADSISLQPLCLNYSPLNNNEGLATYFREHLRLELKELLKEQRKPSGMAYNLYTDGLKVFTSIDAQLQKYAEEAVAEHMAYLQKEFEDHLQGAPAWENDTILLLAKQQSPLFRSLKSQGKDSTTIDSIFDIPRKMTVFSWNGREETREMSPMDSIKHYLSLLNAGFLAMEPKTGQVKAWVGGIDHKYFKYDHVKSRRQVGSTFKPIVYTTAINKGIHPCAHIPNTLRTYWRYEGWQPRNADNKYGGLYSMEGGLINSVNTVTVQLAMRAKPARVAEMAENLGIEGEVPRVPAIALGAVEASLQEMVTVYGTFANRGRRPELSYIRRIETQDGEVIVDYENQLDTSQWEKVLAVNEADMINQMLRKAVDRGTGIRLRYRYKFTNDLAGKTGTSQNHSDGWFMGYTPELVSGVWVGAESPAVRFRNLRLGQGANTALPIFANFTQKINADQRYAKYAEATFPEPDIEVLSKLNCANTIWPEPDSLSNEQENAVAAIGADQPQSGSE